MAIHYINGALLILKLVTESGPFLDITHDFFLGESKTKSKVILLNISILIQIAFILHIRPFFRDWRISQPNQCMTNIGMSMWTRKHIKLSITRHFFTLLIWVKISRYVFSIYQLLGSTRFAGKS